MSSWFIRVVATVAIETKSCSDLRELFMKSTRYAMIEQHIDSFPVLPATVSRIMEVTNDPNSSAQDVMEVIQPDQSLSLTVLKIANSVLFGRPKKVDSLKLAVTILGYNEVQSIALSKALYNSFNELPREQRPFIDIFWQHSFLCGLAARRIAGDLDYQQDIAFMAGLIHDVGKLVMLQTFGEDYTPGLWMARLSIESMLEEEKQIFSFAHDEIGGQLLSKWNFPDTLMSAVSCHHHPENAKTEKAYAYVVQLADILSFYCSNPEYIDEDIVTIVTNTLPDVKEHWKKVGLPLRNDAINAWFDWLVENEAHSQKLRDMFSA